MSEMPKNNRRMKLFVNASAFIAGNHQGQDLVGLWHLDGGGASTAVGISRVE